MINCIRSNRWFLLPFLAFLLIGGMVLVSFSKTDIHWFLNQQNHPLADWFFKVYTHLGDGIMIVLALIILLFIKYRYALVLAFSSIFATLLVQFLKRYLFNDLRRPVVIFEKLGNLHLVEGVTPVVAYSFPSGHSATGFGIFLLFALISKNKYLKLIFFMSAFLIACSRIYLSQHFLVDVYFGSLIGAFCTFFCYLWVRGWKSPKLDNSFSAYFKSKK